MWRKLWRWLKNLLQRLFRRKSIKSRLVPQTAIDYETTFLELLIKVEAGYSETQSLEWLQRYDSLENWQTWLQSFGRYLLTCKSLNLELAHQLIQLQNNGCGKIGILAGEIGNQLLEKAEQTHQSVTQKPEPPPPVAVPIPPNLNTLEGVLNLLQQNPRMVQQLARELKLETVEPQLILREIEVRAWVQEGTMRRKQGKFAEAIAAFDHAIALKSDYALIWAVRGNALFDAKHYEKAITSYDRALELQPDDGETSYNRATALYHLKRYPETIAACDYAISLNPNLPHLWTIRGLASLNHQDLPQAIHSFEQALSLNPNDASAKKGLATAQRQYQPPPASDTL